jgi:hypothetical protein
VEKHKGSVKKQTFVQGHHTHTPQMKEKSLCVVPVPLPSSNTKSVHVGGVRDKISPSECVVREKVPQHIHTSKKKQDRGGGKIKKGEKNSDLVVCGKQKEQSTNISKKGETRVGGGTTERKTPLPSQSAKVSTKPVGIPPPKTLLEAKKSPWWEGYQGAIKMELENLEKLECWDVIDIKLYPSEQTFYGPSSSSTTKGDHRESFSSSKPASWPWGSPRSRG